jgi:phosphate starvation-inducible PhoH-like protein
MAKTNKRRQSNVTEDVTSLSSDSSIISSPKVNIRKEKRIKFQFLLKKIKEKVVLKENQKEYAEKIKNNTITFCYGPAGTSKTFTACYILLEMLFEEKIDKIIFTKPIKESGENLGFLPGDIDQKIGPYMESFIYTCKEIIGEDNVEFLLTAKFIEAKPLAYMRGITFNRCGLFLDEAQNSVYEQLMLYITRLGNESIMVISGDVTQRDIEKKKVVLPEFIEMFKNINKIALHEFTKKDIVRNALLIQITEKYEEWKDSKNL